MTNGRWRVSVAALMLAVCAGAAMFAAEPPPGGAKQSLGPRHPQVVLEEQRLKEMQAIEQELQSRLGDFDRKLVNIREQMRASNGGRPVEGLRETVAVIQQDAMRVRIDFAGMEARKDVIEKAMAAAREEAAKRADGDAVVSQYRELVKLLELSLKQSQERHKAGVVEGAEVRQAEVALAEAKVKLLERQQAAAGASDVSKLADQLIGLSASLSEARARLGTMEEWLATYERLQRLMDEEQEVKWQMNKLRNMIEHVEKVRLDERLGTIPRRAEN
jgi:hypothetical protein